MQVTVCKEKNLKQWDAEKTEKADQSGLEILFSGLRINPPLSDFSAFSASNYSFCFSCLVPALPVQELR
jgi:hypothetical protein